MPPKEPRIRTPRRQSPQMMPPEKTSLGEIATTAAEVVLAVLAVLKEPETPKEKRPTERAGGAGCDGDCACSGGGGPQIIFTRAELPDTVYKNFDQYEITVTRPQ